MTRHLLTTPEAAEALAIPRSKLYELLAALRCRQLASWCLGWGIAQPLPPPAARIATRQRKKIECLLVLASAADSAVKWA